MLLGTRVTVRCAAVLSRIQRSPPLQRHIPSPLLRCFEYGYCLDAVAGQPWPVNRSPLPVHPSNPLLLPLPLPPLPPPPLLRVCVCACLKVCLRWILQRGAVIAAGTGHNASKAASYAAENLGALSMNELSAEEMTKLGQLQL